MECEAFRSMLSEIADRDLPDDMMQAAVAHEETCAACRSDLNGFRVLVRAAQALPDPVPGESVRFEILDPLLSLSEPPAVPEIMETEDLRRYLGVSAEELEEEIENIPAFEFAGRLRFKKEHIDRLIEERERDRARSIEAARAGAWTRRRTAG